MLTTEWVDGAQLAKSPPEVIKRLTAVGVDCFLIAPEGVKTHAELEFEADSPGHAALDAARVRGSIPKCLVVRCCESTDIFTHYVYTLRIKYKSKVNFRIQFISSIL